MKKKIVYTLLIAFLICFVVACGKKETSISGDLPVERIEGSYLVDVDDPVALISSADYVFIGNVVKNNGCEYMDGERPYTNYDIRVIENIKGELRTDIDVPIIKWGGISVDGSCYEVYEEDLLPEVGDICIFTAYGTEDGGLSVGGANSTKLLEAPKDFMTVIEPDKYIEEILGKNEEYNKYIRASEDQFPAEEVEVVELEHYKSQYEK